MGGTSERSPPRQNSCRLDRTFELGALMEELNGQVRTRIQGQSGGAVAAAGERVGGRGVAGDWRECCHA